MISSCNNSNSFRRRLFVPTHLCTSTADELPDRSAFQESAPTLSAENCQTLSLPMLNLDRASFAAVWAEVTTPRADHARWQLCALAYAKAG